MHVCINKDISRKHTWVYRSVFRGSSRIILRYYQDAYTYRGRYMVDILGALVLYNHVEKVNHTAHDVDQIYYFVVGMMTPEDT